MILLTVFPHFVVFFNVLILLLLPLDFLVELLDFLKLCFGGVEGFLDCYVEFNFVHGFVCLVELVGIKLTV